MTLVLAIGVATGCVYGLIAVGYSLIYRTTGVVNFAQGSYVVLGGLTTWRLSGSLKVNYALAVLGGVVVAGAVAGLFWLAVIIPLWRRRSPPYVVLLSTVVVSALLTSLIGLVITEQPQTLPAWVPGLKLRLGGTVVGGQYLLVVVVAIGCVGLIVPLLRYTMLGRSMRACAADRETSRLLGISPERVGAAAMVLTGMLGGLAGAVITPAQLTSASQGLTYGVFGFAAAIIGGFGSLPGALAGGIVTGILQTAVSRYLSANYETVTVFAVLIALLIVRPGGMFGAREAGHAR